MSGRKVFTREVLSSADVNDLLMEQTVMRFASAAARGVQLPAPEPNMLTALDTAPGRVDYWHPTAGAGATGVWLPLNYGAIRGKMWRTIGFSGAVAAPITQLVAMQASRLSGGFTFDGTNMVLGIPLDGRYDLAFGSYATGGSTATGSWTVTRKRSGVGDGTAANTIWYKSSSVVDQWAPHRTDDIPLKAGDTLGLYVTLYAGTVAHYGINEGSGSFLSATYVGPLNGATPV